MALHDEQLTEWLGQIARRLAFFPALPQNAGRNPGAV